MRPHADTIDASRGEDFEGLSARGLGVALDGELKPGFGETRDEIVEFIEYAPPQLGAEETRRAATYKDGLEPPSEQIAHGTEFQQERVGIGLLLISVVHKGIEVTIVALVGAERHMEVEGVDRPGRPDKYLPGIGGSLPPYRDSDTLLVAHRVSHGAWVEVPP